MSKASVTIDVDSIRHYRAIHGLPERPDDEDPIYTIAMPRFWALLEELEIPATLFLIGADAPKYASVFEPVLSSGSEVASHSYAHDYRLTAKNRAEILNDLRQADEVLRPLNGGRKLRGFRAPGYNINAELLSCVEELGYEYDSSVLPSPMYFGARWSIIKLYAAMGRESQSMSGSWQQFTRSLKPYRFSPHNPFKALSHGPLIELPIACVPGIRLPLIGTSLAMLPSKLQNLTVDWSLNRLSFFNFEMHGIDLLDKSDHPSIAELAQYQRDVHVPASVKLKNHRDLFSKLKAKLEVVTLDQVRE